MEHYMVRKTVTRCHFIEVNDEVLNDYQNKYGFDYIANPNYCGTCSEELEIIGREDDSPDLD
nr:MAG TPA: hypothetical protein [Caudoviricetes sp.]